VIKTGSAPGIWILATFSFSSPVLLFAAPYQDILLQTEEPISGSVSFSCRVSLYRNHHEASDATASYLQCLRSANGPFDAGYERAFDAIVEQMQAELGSGPRHLRILVSYLKIF